MNTYERSRAGMLIEGFAAVILGLYMLMNPAGVTTFAIGVIGWVVVIMGVLTLLSSFRRFSALFAQADFYVGVIEFLFGLLLISMPGMFVVWLFVILGFGIVLSGITSLQVASLLRVGTGMPIFTPRVIASSIVILLGLIVAAAPFMVADFAVVLAGGALVFGGITKISEGFGRGHEQA